MPFKAQVYRILIASPSDVGEERQIIPEVISEWNAVSAFTSKIILMPVKWETNTSPLLGGRPQSIINEQIVKDSDLLVGVFWTRIGSNTGAAVSGTAEEIQQFVDDGKPVMLYFSQSPIDPEKIDIEQFTALKLFKDKMRKKGLTEAYSGAYDFRQKFTRQLAINLNNLVDTLALALKAKGQEPSKKTTKETKKAIESLKDISEDEARSYLIKAMEATAGEDGWANIAAFGSYLLTFTPVNHKKLGFKKLRPYLDSSALFQFRESPNNQVEISFLPKALQDVIVTLP